MVLLQFVTGIIAIILVSATIALPTAWFIWKFIIKKWEKQFDPNIHGKQPKELSSTESTTKTDGNGTPKDGEPRPKGPDGDSGSKEEASKPEGVQLPEVSEDAGSERTSSTEERDPASDLAGTEQDEPKAKDSN